MAEEERAKAEVATEAEVTVMAVTAQAAGEVAVVVATRCRLVAAVGARAAVARVQAQPHLRPLGLRRSQQLHRPATTVPRARWSAELSPQQWQPTRSA